MNAFVQPIGSNRAVELQSLRGIAALTVIFSHCFLYFDYGDRLQGVFEVVFNAHAAVVLFFVLSGFMLALSLRSGGQDLAGVAGFYVRRLVRLYPALWAGAVVALFAVFVLQDQPLAPNVSDWWWPQHRREMPEGAFRYVKLFLGISTSVPLPVWTLFIELVGSAIMPFVVLLLFKNARAYLLVTLALTAVQLGLGHRILGLTLYMPCFFVGAAVVRLLPWFEYLALSCRRVVAIGLFGAIVLWFGRHLFASDFRTHYGAPIPVLVESLGAAVLIGAIFARAQVFGLLRHATVAWLGDISYSLYLVHMPVMAIVAGLAVERWALPGFLGVTMVPTLLLSGVVVSISIPLAAAGFRFIELPSIRAGKRWGRNVTAWFYHRQATALVA